MVIRKSRAEIEKMRKAGLVVASTLSALRKMVEPGISTLDLDAFAEKNIRAHGAHPTFKGYQVGYVRFPASICASVNNEVVHGIPSHRKLKEGDIIKLDCGATLGGYVGDAAITVGVGEVAPELQKLMEVTRDSLFRAKEKMIPGNRLSDVGFAVQEYCEAHGYSIVRDYCGHGIGQRMHEDPQVPNYGTPGTGKMLKEGWVLAVEPMVNLGNQDVQTEADGWTVTTVDGLASCHFEHTIAITDDGPIILTAREDGDPYL